MSGAEKTEAAGAATPTASGKGQADHGLPAHSTAARFAVVCQNDDGRRRIFGKYPTRAEAEHFASALRKIGCPAEIEEEIEEQPEYAMSRRAFLIGMVMLGRAPRERIVERAAPEVARALDELTKGTRDAA